MLVYIERENWIFVSVMRQVSLKTRREIKERREREMN